MDNAFFGFQSKVHCSLKEVKKRKMEIDVNYMRLTKKYMDQIFKLANVGNSPFKICQFTLFENLALTK